MAGRALGFRSLVKALGKWSPAQIRKAIALAPQLERVEKLERDRNKHLAAIKKLDRKIAKLSGGNGSVAVSRKRRRRKMSAETRRKMSAAAKRRYAQTKETAPATVSKPARRKLSAEARQKMAEAARRRWATVKGSAKGAETAK